MKGHYGLTDLLYIVLLFLVIVFMLRVLGVRI